ncbi:MAG: AsmA-like C-terminal domain-containing protein [Mariprofundales bacterium]|nr:AsmA-like C-terminal domain-containing protein [Mariprofundales bacterium]
MKHWICHCAASCWRIFLALLLSLILLPIGAFFLFAPDAKSLQPQLEQVVAQRMGLGKVTLGTLSWHWSGWLWLHSDAFSLATADNMLQFTQAKVDIQLSLRDLLHGNLTPKRINFSGGTMAINHHFLDSPMITLPAIIYNFSHLKVRWSEPGWSHIFSIQKLSANLAGGDFQFTMPDLSIQGQLRPNLLPARATIRWKSLHWLPKRWIHGVISGDMQGAVQLTSNHLRWSLRGAIDRTGAAPLTIHLRSGHYPIDHLDGVLLSIWHQTAKGLSLKAVQLPQAHWNFDSQTITAKGEWEAGLATLDAHSNQLEMPLVWSWLRPLGEHQWHKWLASMQSGIASNAHATIQLPWATPLSTAPDWAQMRYQVSAGMADVDIALGLNGDVLIAAKGTLGINEHHLWAKVTAATLPHQLGTIHGSLNIPWNTLELAIHGEGDTDVRKILQWQGLQQQVSWQQSQATTSFDLRWNAAANRPSRAKIILRPKQPWNLTFAGIHARFEDGYAEWQPGRLTMKEMSCHIGKLNGSCQAVAEEGKSGWKLSSLTAKSRIDLTNPDTIATPFISQPHGELQLTLQFDGQWRGSIHASDASWRNLLGWQKKMGTPLTIKLNGIRFNPDNSHWSVRDIESKNQIFIVQHAKVDFHHGLLSIDIPSLHTPAMDGAFHLTIPEATSKAASIHFTISKLDRDALRPMVDQWRHRQQTQKWLADGTIDQFHWGDGFLAQGVQLHRNLDGVNHVTIAKLEMDHITTTSLATAFTLSPQSVDVHKLTATVDHQKLMISATMHKLAAPNTGWQWSGFATLDGPFGGLMKDMKLSNLFSDGSIHALFLGQGELHHRQPWWQSLQGRLRMRVDDGRLLKSGTMTRFLAATSLIDLPRFLVGERKDLTGKGMLFRHLQLEGTMDHGVMKIRRMALRSSAMDVAGTGSLDIGKDHADVYLVAHPFQNIDAIIDAIPIVRDILGGAAHTLFRKIYHLHGPLNDAIIEASTAKAAGLKSAGVIDTLLNLPSLWFGEATTPQ